MELSKSNFDKLLTDKEFFELDARLGKFNIFSAIGAERAELRHSNFLAHLLNPREAHGLGDRFLVEFLVRATTAAPMNFSAADVVLNDWSRIEVRREWRGIDVLLFDRTNGFVCCIENKIDAGEHGDQLSRYAESVNHDFPEVKFPHRLFLYLTPDGQESSQEKFQPVGYELVLEVAKSVIADIDPRSGMGYVLNQYIDLIGGKIMQDAEMEQLCSRIYNRHRDVLNKIIELGKPDMTGEFREFLLELVGGSRDAGLELDKSTKAIVRFADTTLDGSDWIKNASDWSDSKRIVLYEFYFRPGGALELSLVLGRGNEDVRQRIFSTCNSAPFNGKQRMGAWPRLWRGEDILTKDDFDALAGEATDADGLKAKVRDYWTSFKTNQLPKLREGLQQVK